MALSNSQQAYAVFISAILIAVGAVAVPSGLPWYVGFALMVIGAIGLAVKEALGAQSSTPATTA
jgi:hypothetical protein